MVTYAFCKTYSNVFSPLSALQGETFPKAREGAFFFYLLYSRGRTFVARSRNVRGTFVERILESPFSPHSFTSRPSVCEHLSAAGFPVVDQDSSARIRVQEAGGPHLLQEVFGAVSAHAKQRGGEPGLVQGLKQRGHVAVGPLGLERPGPHREKAPDHVPGLQARAPGQVQGLLVLPDVGIDLQKGHG